MEKTVYVSMEISNLKSFNPEVGAIGLIVVLPTYLPIYHRINKWLEEKNRIQTE